MASAVTAKSPRRLLLNAEPFGFGPTAAIADCFPALRSRFARVGFVGLGHTLDLQRSLDYDEVHDISGLSGAVEQDQLSRVFSQYDVLLTALDFGMAERALTAGLEVYVYDPLTWYWKSIPPVLSRGVHYLAQDFFGVRERLQEQSDCFSSAQVVAPLVPAGVVPAGNKETVLLNLGGLSNPFWSAADTLNYARLVVESFCLGVAGGKDSVVIAANATIASELSSYGVCNYSREQMQRVLADAKYALMTPGLGNIYDAARFRTATIWLPPANDSQGQQLRLIAEHGLADGFVDWHDLLEGRWIDYRGDQRAVLQSISDCVALSSADDKARALLASRFAQLVGGIKSGGAGRCSQLLERFGSGGANQVAAAIRA